MRRRSTGSQPRYNLECRDAVHGFVYLTADEWSIVDCPTFQRLRDIRQLAMAHLVYPGATHTRFEHSLGCVHLADMIFLAICRRVEQGDCDDFGTAFRASDDERERGRQLLRIASLLHDIGHSPFSHSGEELMQEVSESSERPRRLTHEDMTVRLIRDTEIAGKIKAAVPVASDAVEEVIAVAVHPEKARLPARSNKAWYRFLNDILTGELGADRMDYLLRDALHSGQTAGIFDYRKLIDSMIIVAGPREAEDEYRLGLDGAGWLVGEQMVVSRYLMYVALYFHKTKRIYEKHLEQFLKRWLTARFGAPTFPVEPLEYAHLTDSAVWAAIYDAARGRDEELRELARPFVDRSHLRLAYELVLADNLQPRRTQDAVSRFVQRLRERPAALTEPGAADEGWTSIEKDLEALLAERRPRRWNEERFAALCEAVDKHVRNKLALNGRGMVTDETRHGALKFFDVGNKIWVRLDENTRYLDDLSEIVRGMPDKIWRGRIYADQAVRDDVAGFCRNWLTRNPAGGGANHGAASP